MLLLKNGIKQLWKDYIQFFIYLILIGMSVVFTTTFGISVSNLIKTNNQVSLNEKHDYSYRYTSSGYMSNDTQTISPWFAFNTDLVSDGHNYFPTLTIGKDGILKPYEFKIESNNNEYIYESSIYTKNNDIYINFHFGDVESNALESKKQSYSPNEEQSRINLSKEQKAKIVQTGEFGSFYRFNFESDYFKNSLIGKLYEKYNLYDPNTFDYSQKQLEIAEHIYDYMFYLNNSSLTSAIKYQITDKYLELKKQGLDDEKIQNEIFVYVNGLYEEPMNSNSYRTEKDIDNDGFQGRIGNIVKYTDSKGKEQYKYYFVNSNKFNLGTNSNLDMDKTLEKSASYLVKNFESISIFKSKFESSGYILNNKHLTSRMFFESYYNLVADLTNFDILMTNEVVMWNEIGQKFRFISAFYNEDDKNQNSIVKFYNQDLYTIYNKYDSEDFLTEKSFMISNGFAKSNNWKLGNEYAIFPKNPEKFRMDAIGVDSLNIYPTIYDEDLLVNQKNEAIIYIHANIFAKYFNYEDKENKNRVLDTNYQDVSKTYMYYKSNNIEQDIKYYEMYSADNLLTLEQVQKDIINHSIDNDFKYSRMNIQSYADTPLINIRLNLFTTITTSLLVISIGFCIAFIISILFVVYNIIRKVLINQRSQLGNLKSLGYSNTKIALTFMAYMIIPVTIVIPLCWIGSLFLQIPIMSIFEIYFNIPTMFTIDWQILLIEWIGFSLLVSGLVFILIYFTVRQSPLLLLAPSKSAKPSFFLSKISSKIYFRKTTSKLRWILFISSIKDVITFTVIMFFSSVILTVSFITPNILIKMSDEYYKNMKYSNNYLYTNVIGNNPLTRYSFYNLDPNNIEQDQQNVSLFNSKVKIGKEEYISLFSNPEYWKEHTSEFNQYFESMLIYNIVTFKGKILSMNIIDEVLKNRPDNYSLTLSNQLVCYVMPKLFGQDIIELDNSKPQYKTCVQKMSNNILPSTIKEMWDKDENSFLNFSFGFGTVPYNKQTDQLYTQFDSVNSKNKNELYTIYGIDLENDSSKLLLNDKELLKPKKENNYIPVTANQKLKIEGYSIGDEIQIETTSPELVMLKENSVKKVKYDAWKYVDQITKKSIDLYEMDLDHFTYYDKSLVSNQNASEFYYYDGENYILEHNMADIQLQLPVEYLDTKLLAQVNEQYFNYSGKSIGTIENEMITVNPFDIYKYEGQKRQPLSIETLIEGTNSWFNIALENNLLATSNRSNIFSKPLKIVGFEDLYDDRKLYMDQNIANQILYDLPYEIVSARKKFDNSSINMYSNAKMSNISTVTDQMERIIFQPLQANNSIQGFGKYMRSSIGKTDYIDIKKEATISLVDSVVSITTIFITIAIITGIIVIYLITELFIGRYKSFMSYMMVFGYSLKEINSIVMWIFLPIAIISTILGILTVGLLINLVIPGVLLSVNIAVPLLVNNLFYLLVFIISLLIFASSYIGIISSVGKIRLSQLLG